MLVAHGLKVLGYRWKLIALMIVLGMVIAMIAIVNSVPMYKSVASVVVDTRAPETIGPQQLTGQTSPEYLMTQEGILQSPRVAEEVVSATGLTRQPGLAERLGWSPDKGSSDEYLATVVQRQMQIEPSMANARIIGIGFVSSDPEFSADMANAFAQGFINVTVALQAEPARRAMQSYVKQMDETVTKLRAAQDQLAMMERRLGVIATPDDSSAEGIGLNTLSTRLAESSVQTSAALSQASVGSLPQISSDPELSQLNGKLADLKSQREQLAPVVGPNNAQYRQLSSQIASVAAAIGQRTAEVRRSYQAAAQQAAAASSGIAAQVANQKQRVTMSQEAQRKLSQLKLDVASSQQAYDQMATRKTQLKVLSDASETNISILTPARPNLIPISPRKKMMVLAGILIGFGIGLVIAIGLEFFDLRLRSAGELEGWLGIPNLAEIRPLAPQRSFLPRPIAGLLPQWRS